MDEDTKQILLAHQKRLENRKQEEIPALNKFLLGEKARSYKPQPATGRQKCSTSELSSKNKNNSNSRAEQTKSMETDDLSRAELHLYNFKRKNAKLKQNESQLPNLLGNCKLFEPVKPGRRKMFRNWQEVPLINNSLGKKFEDIKIYYKNEQLNQHDLTAWLILIKLIKSDFNARFTKYEFLKALNLKDAGNNYKWLDNVLTRLNSTLFKVQFTCNGKKYTYQSSLIEHQIKDDEAERYVVKISEPLRKIFNVDGWSITNIKQRLELGQKQQAQAFHAFLSTHKCPDGGLWIAKRKLKEDFGPNYQKMTDFLKKFRARVIRPLKQVDFLKKTVENEGAIGFFW